MSRDNDKEIELLGNIYHNLAIISYKANEKELFLTYSKLALKTAYQSKNTKLVAHSLLEMFGAYRKVNNIDSAQYYLNKCIPLIEQVPDKNKVSFYNNIGTFMLEKDIHQAEEYFNKALVLAPDDAFAYRGLAKVYFKKGHKRLILNQRITLKIVNWRAMLKYLFHLSYRNYISGPLKGKALF